MTYTYDPTQCLSVRNAAFEKRMSVAEYLAWERAEELKRAAEREFDLRTQQAWNAMRDEYERAGDWVMVLTMDNA